MLQNPVQPSVGQDPWRSVQTAAAGVERTRVLLSLRPQAAPQHCVAVMNALGSGSFFWPVLLVSLCMSKFALESVFYNYANHLKYLAQMSGY